MHDFRNAFRALRAAPLTSLAAVLVIALGAGANLAVFAIAYGVLVRPLPYPEASRLVTLRIQNADGTDFGVRLGEIRDWRERLRTVEGLAGYVTSEAPVRGVATPRLAWTAQVTEEFFDVLGVAPSYGRLAAFRESPSAAVLSRRLASALAGGPPGAVGRGVTVGAQAAGVAAVVPEAFAFPAENVDVWTRAMPAGGEGDGHDPRSFTLVLRLAAGVTLERARDDARRALREIRGEFFDEPGAPRPELTPIEDLLFGDLRPVLAASASAAILVLLVTCGNVAMLLLERALARRRDAAVRLALGAGWRQLARGPLAESLLLAAAGSLLGLGLAGTGVELFARVAAGVVPRAASLSLDGPSVVAALAVVALVTVLCGAGPALWTARRDFAAAFREGPAGEPRTRRLLGALVAGQIAASIVLLTGAALLARTVGRLMEGGAGADAGQTLTAKLSFGDGTGVDRAAGAAFARRVLERARALPGVEEAGIGSALPPAARPFQVYVRWRTETRDDGLMMGVVSVTPGFLEALGVAPVSGRLPAAADDRLEPPVALLSETAARFYSPDGDITGRFLPVRLPPVAPLSGPPRVLGVVRDAKYAGLDQPADAAIYLPWSARPTETSYLAVHASGDPRVLAGALRRALREADAELPMPPIRTLEEEMARSIADRRLRVLPSLGFAAVALAVTLTGIFALLARAAAERRRDFAVRMALGASRSQVRGLMLRRAALLVAAGLAAGVAGTFAVADGLRGLLYGVVPHDPATLLGVCALVAAAALLAAWVPARRAAQTEPWELLRSE